MGCLNSDGKFTHWFGNIHLSGPCNRSCYFCIGQHMMALDALNTLDAWPLPGMDKFIAECKAREIQEVNLTGTNTDPLLCNYLNMIGMTLREEIPGVRIGLRTNGAKLLSRTDILHYFDKISISVTSLEPEIYRKTMGSGSPPDLAAIRKAYSRNLKINMVLCPETVGGDFIDTLQAISKAGIGRVNMREPYGQPHLGNPMPDWGFTAATERLGMPVYEVFGVEVTYWDVHYVEVESVNLYASGRVSIDYPITRGHAESGDVRGQEHFKTSGWVRQQWLSPEAA